MNKEASCAFVIPCLVANRLPQACHRNEGCTNMRFRYLFIFGIGLLAALAGCYTEQHPQNPDDLKEKTAQATAALKSDAKAVASGIREGWSRNNPLDLNTATRDQLMSLPGVTAAEADRVIAGRPYGDPGELVTRHIMAKSQYDKIADRLTVKK